MFITSKNKYLSNDMKIFRTCSIPLMSEPMHGLKINVIVVAWYVGNFVIHNIQMFYIAYYFPYGWIIVLYCHVWLNPVLEVKYPGFPTTRILCKKSRFPWILCKRYRLLVQWLWYQWHHLPIVILFSCPDNVTYPWWHDNWCLLWYNVFTSYK